MRYSKLPPSMQTIPGRGKGQVVIHWSQPPPDLKLYDHEVHYRGGPLFSTTFIDQQRRLFAGLDLAHRYPMRAECSCGWKVGGPDYDLRAEAHIRKLRAWLDDHPEEEVMAGLGGQINWPAKTKRHKNRAWNKKRKKR
jgi:hypothetical protein